MAEAPRERVAALWLRLLGLALVPLAVQAAYAPLGGALSILTPLPLAYGIARRGWLEGYGAVAVVAQAYALALSPEAGLFFILETVPLCSAIAWVSRTAVPFHAAVPVGVAAVAAVTAGAAALYGVASGMGPADLYQEVLGRSGLLMEAAPDAQGIPPEARERVALLVETWKRLFFGIWLATLVLLVAFFSSLVRGWLEARGAAERRAPALSSWRLPFPFVVAFIVLAAGQILGGGWVAEASLNALIPLATLFGIQGAVVVGHLLARWSIPSVLRVIILLFLALQVPTVLMVGIALAGLFDTWVDFRRRFPPRPEAPAA